MRHPHNGVLLPASMDDATEVQKDEYAEQAKRTNRAFIYACFALEDEAARLGVELDS